MKMRIFRTFSVKHYRYSEYMIVLPFQNACMSGGLVVLGNRIGNITTIFQVRALGRERARVNVWAVNDV